MSRVMSAASVLMWHSVITLWRVVRCSLDIWLVCFSGPHLFTSVATRCSLITSPFATHFACIPFAIAVIIKYDFASWTPTDVVFFEHHYNVTLSKVEGQNAKLVCDCNAMKGFMLKYEAAEVQTLPPHMVGITLTTGIAS